MSNTQKIYSVLTSYGMTQDGALGVLGNLDCESNLYSCRLQGDYDAGFTKSKNYASQVDSGAYNRYTFAHDARGWGLAQWTFWSRKEELYDFCKQRGKSIGDLDTQIDFLIHELKTGYATLWAFLCSTDDLLTAVSRVCKEYENPDVKNIKDRYEAALRIKEQLGNIETVEPDEPKQAEKTVGQLAIEVLQRKWGDGEERKQALTAAGYDASAVQNEVNRLWKAREIAMSNVEHAVEVLAGIWGDGDVRKAKMAEAGLNWAAIQAIVNYM